MGSVEESGPLISSSGGFSEVVSIVNRENKMIREFHYKVAKATSQRSGGKDGSLRK